MATKDRTLEHIEILLNKSGIYGDDTDGGTFSLDRVDEDFHDFLATGEGKRFGVDVSYEGDDHDVAYTPEKLQEIKQAVVASEPFQKYIADEAKKFDSMSYSEQRMFASTLMIAGMQDVKLDETGVGTERKLSEASIESIRKAVEDIKDAKAPVPAEQTQEKKPEADTKENAPDRKRGRNVSSGKTNDPKDLPRHERGVKKPKEEEKDPEAEDSKKDPEAEDSKKEPKAEDSKKEPEAEDSKKEPKAGKDDPAAAAVVGAAPAPVFDPPDISDEAIARREAEEAAKSDLGLGPVEEPEMVAETETSKADGETPKADAEKPAAAAKPEETPKVAKPKLTYDEDVATLQALLAQVDPDYQEFMTYKNSAGEEVFKDGLRGGKTEQVIQSFAVAEKLDLKSDVKTLIDAAKKVLNDRSAEAQARQEAQNKQKAELDRLNGENDALKKKVESLTEVHNKAARDVGEHVDVFKEPNIYQSGIDSFKSAKEAGFSDDQLKNGVIFSASEYLLDDDELFVARMNDESKTIEVARVQRDTDLKGLVVHPDLHDSIKSAVRDRMVHADAKVGEPITIALKGAEVSVTPLEKGDDDGFLDRNPIKINSIQGNTLENGEQAVKPDPVFYQPEIPR